MSIPRFRIVSRVVSIVGILAVCALMVSACAVTDINEAPTTENPSTATTPPGSTPTPPPTPAPTPTQGPKPGLTRDDAVAIRLGETIESRFSTLYPDIHFYTIQLEEGTSYTVDITDTLRRSSVSIFDSGSEALTRNTDSDGNQVSRIVWTAPKSDTYFMMVIGSDTNNYTLTVTGGETIRASAPTQTTTPGISSTQSPSGTALTFASLSAGETHTCGVTTNGAVYCWGLGGYGQLGDGLAHNDNNTQLVAVSGGLTFTSVSAGEFYTCGITNNAAAYCWGSGDDGQLGNGSNDNQLAPVAVLGGLTFASVSAGRDHSCGVTTGGAAYCWGRGPSGRLGNGSWDSQTSPVAVAGGLTFASVSAGRDHSCGVTTSGTAYCWGQGGSSQIGDGENITRDTPVAVSSGLTFVSVIAGIESTCGIPTGGGAYCWGGGRFGILGNGTDDRQWTPTPVSERLGFTSVSTARWAHTCGVTTNGTAYCWGFGSAGVLGNGTEGNHFTPVAVSGGLEFASVSVGKLHTCGVTTDGIAYCWGVGSSENFDGSTPNSNTPVPIANP